VPISLISNLNFEKKRVYVGSVIFCTAVILDQVTKKWAQDSLGSKPRFIGSTEIGFSLTSNSGSAFSLFQDSTFYLTIAGLFIVSALFVAAFKTDSTLLSYCYIGIAGGAIGNIIDRFAQPPYAGHGHVIDFIKVGGFPTFNVADSFITVSAVCLVLLSVFNHKEKYES